jgi:hypothetical protein
MLADGTPEELRALEMPRNCASGCAGLPEFPDVPVLSEIKIFAAAVQQPAAEAESHPGRMVLSY